MLPTCLLQLERKAFAATRKAGVKCETRCKAQQGLARNAQKIGATPMRIAGLVACYNRVALTLRCLTSLFETFEHQDATLEIFLVDDGSPDKTGEIVKQRFPQVHVITGTGSL